MLVLIGARVAGCCLVGAGDVLCLPPEAGWGVGCAAVVVDVGADERGSGEGEGVLVGAVGPKGSSTWGGERRVYGQQGKRAYTVNRDRRPIVNSMLMPAPKS